MHCTHLIAADTWYVGASDRRLAKFENLFPIPRGVSYNSYVILDEKTALLDTADASVSGQFLENVAHALGGRSLDYLIVDHMEPDHAATIAEVLLRWPEAQIVCNAKTVPMLKAYFPASAGKVDEAAAVQNEICRIIYAMCAAHGNLYAVLKAILAKRGVVCGSVRKPLPALAEADLAIVDQAAAQIDAAIAKYC